MSENIKIQEFMDRINEIKVREIEIREQEKGDRDGRDS
jgi:hypothetical protein